MAFLSENIKQIKNLQKPSNTSILTSAIDSNSFYSNDGQIVADYPGVLDSELTALTQTQKHLFISLTSVLCGLSICGNVGTLYVNSRPRKIRPFFQSCLISLAFSDLLTTIFLTVGYLGQIKVEYVQIWNLGACMCALVPFATTTSILASSMTLVGIGLDRYFAVMKAVIGFWNPRVLYCVICMLGIWTASIAIASPVLYIYTIFPVYILTEDTNATVTNDKSDYLHSSEMTTDASNSWETIAANDNNQLYILVKELQLVQMCVSDQRDVTLYYVIVFTIIFIPCILAFIWLNAVIAKKIWIRRRSVSQKRKNTIRCFIITKTEMSVAEENQEIDIISNGNNRQICSCKIPHSTTIRMPSTNIEAQQVQDTATEFQPPANILDINSNTVTISAKNNYTNITRETRHIRMFTIIIIMIAVFIFLRLPAWIFLLMRMYGNYTKPVHLVIFLSFGVLNLASCGLNPLFYTFLTETIQCALFVKGKIRESMCCLKPCCCHYKDNRRCICVLTFCSCCFWGVQNEQHAQSSNWNKRSNLDSKLSSDEQSVNNDKDEGVECSDEDEESGDTISEYNQRIYTIYPISLVSSSITS